MSHFHCQKRLSTIFFSGGGAEKGSVQFESLNLKHTAATTGVWCLLSALASERLCERGLTESPLSPQLSVFRELQLQVWIHQEEQSHQTARRQRNPEGKKSLCLLLTCFLNFFKQYVINLIL